LEGLKTGEFDLRRILSGKTDGSWPSSMKIRSYTFEEYVERVWTFHDFAAPGVVIGGFMVDLAYQLLPGEGLYNALSETPKCLPDAIQLLTPCTLGNGRLTVINVGRYALTLYEKFTGEGVRVTLNPARIEGWSEIKEWLFKLKPKKEQNYDLLMRQIEEAGTGICRSETVRVAPRFLERKRRGEIGVCPTCGEPYPLADGARCHGCQGEALYAESDMDKRRG
jgi:formylmethanofuran dehydrogenase subunit E